MDLQETVLQSRDAIELLADKWRIAILHVLTLGPIRTSQLQRALHQVSPKMLAQTLRGMERDGLVKRSVHSVLPPRVEYQLTPMGRSLIKPLHGLCQWAKAHVAERDEARKKYETMDRNLVKSKAAAHS